MELTILKESQHFADADKKYELSALIDADSFFYGVFDYGQSIQRIGRSTFAHPETASLLKDSRATIRKFKLALLSPVFTLIPREEYSPEDLGSYLTATYPDLPLYQYILRSDHISQLDVRVCYPVEKNQLTALTNRYDSASLTHYVSTLLEYIPREKDGIYVLCIEDNAIVIGMKSGRLHFCNQERLKSYLDTFYTIQNACDLLYEGDNNYTIYIAGAGNKMDELISLLQKYHPHIEPLSPQMTMDGEIVTDSNYLFPLYTISKCG